MRQTEENATAMFEATLLYLDKNNNTWSGVPALVEAVNEAGQNVQAIRKMASSGKSAITGVLDDKIHARNALEDLTLDIAHALTALAIRTDNSRVCTNADFSGT